MYIYSRLSFINRQFVCLVYFFFFFFDFNIMYNVQMNFAKQCKKIRQTSANSMKCFINPNPGAIFRNKSESCFYSEMFRITQSLS